ncbi:MAG: SpoVG family protein [Bacilli bacterium]|nr:SpoVG family protein [Bacilli bacterium]
MKITSVNVQRVEEDPRNPKMKGRASVILDDCFAITGIRIIEGEHGLFLAMPSRKTSSGKNRDVAHPINQETRQMFEDTIIEEFLKQE